jgi:hypothetical protein
MNDFPSEVDIANRLPAFVQLAGGTVRTEDTYEPLAKSFQLSEFLLSRETGTGANAWRTKVRSAREYLAKKEFVLRPRKRHPTLAQKDNEGLQAWWELTPSGKLEADRQISYLGTSAREQLERRAVPVRELRKLPDLF